MSLINHLSLIFSKPQREGNTIVEFEAAVHVRLNTSQLQKLVYDLEGSLTGKLKVDTSGLYSSLLSNSSSCESLRSWGLLNCCSACSQCLLLHCDPDPSAAALIIFVLSNFSHQSVFLLNIRNNKKTDGQKQREWVRLNVKKGSLQPWFWNIITILRFQQRSSKVHPVSFQNKTPGADLGSA